MFVPFPSSAEESMSCCQSGCMLGMTLVDPQVSDRGSRIDVASVQSSSSHGPVIGLKAGSRGSVWGRERMLCIRLPVVLVVGPG